MANRFTSDILIQVEDPSEAAKFYVQELGFKVTGASPMMVSIHGDNINFFIEQGPPLGPVLEITVADVATVRAKLVQKGCTVIKDEPKVPRCYLRDRFGLIYNLTMSS